jgi:hypothetical protein
MIALLNVVPILGHSVPAAAAPFSVTSGLFMIHEAAGSFLKEFFEGKEP